MTIAALFATLIGLVVTVYLVLSNGGAEIQTAILSAGWGILLVVAMHLPQSLFSSLGWRSVSASDRNPSRLSFFGIRLIREAVNSLLPVAQVGGEFVGARLLALRGVPLRVAGASATVDLTLEIVSQVGFTLLGLALLMLDPEKAGIINWIGGSILAAVGVIAAFIVAQRYGLFQLLEAGILRLARKQNWKGAEQLAGLHDEIVTLYRSPGRLLRGTSYHLMSWLLGGLEIMAALHVVGVPVDLRGALIVESLGQAFKSLGFAVPGALGVQEGGFILACGLVGVGPQSAIELSLLKRIRELTLGLPGLLAWQLIEGRRLAAPATSEAISKETIS